MALITIRSGLLRDAADLRQGGKKRLAVELWRGGVRRCREESSGGRMGPSILTELSRELPLNSHGSRP